MKTAIIIKSDSFQVKHGDTHFDNVSISNVFVNGEDWRPSNNQNGVDVNDIKHYLELLLEATAMCIDYLANKNVDTEINLLKKSKDRIDKSLFTVSSLHEVKSTEDFKANEIKL